jgi:hypothetical protein
MIVRRVTLNEIVDQIRSGSEHAEHNCGRLIDKEFGRRKSGET